MTDRFAFWAVKRSVSFFVLSFYFGLCYVSGFMLHLLVVVLLARLIIISFL